ncbi:MAG: class I SAM-dependent methyltransferase [Chloroflexaceae bacterium]|jgi:SAM-dependent methyltransferase|nr:class I SAM-dependent methyltransferase [Chloroflexaceae bacterium]
MMVQVETPATAYTSSNLRKHTNPNPLQRWLLERFHRTAATLCAQSNATSILDAGCGEGIALHRVLALSGTATPMPTLVGLDNSLGALKIARTLQTRQSFTSGDLLNLPFPDKRFDLVVSMEVLEHLENPHLGLQELCRVSRRWLLLSVPNEPFFRGANFLRAKNVRAWGNDPGHVNHWSSQAFLRFVSTQCRVHTWRTSFPWTLALCNTA